MSLFRGIHPLSVPSSALARQYPSLSMLILGSAPDGVIGESRCFLTPGQVLMAYGGVQTSEISVSGSDFSTTLSIIPDYPSLRFYDFSGTNSQPVEFPFLTKLEVGNALPVILNFDPLGPTTITGGLKLQTQTLYTTPQRTSLAAGNSLKDGDLRLPLVSAIQETAAYQLWGQRVGLSWLPPAPAQTTLTISGLASVLNAALTFEALGIGDASAQDPYTAISITLSGTALTIDPGRAPLPFQRCVYSYSAYTSWIALLSQITLDYESGICPVWVRQSTASSAFLSATPSSLFTGGETPVTQTLAYLVAGSSAPDLTTASGWLSVLTLENLDLESFGLLSFAGLSGRALNTDRSSAQKILDLLLNLEDPPLLVLPWSFESIPADPSQDAQDALNLKGSLTPEAESLLLFFWGSVQQKDIPDVRTSAGILPSFIPGAYSAAGALIRESLQSQAGNPGRPEIISAQLVPGFQLPTLSEPASGVIPTSSPTPVQIKALQTGGLTPVIMILGSKIGIAGPLSSFSGELIQTTLCLRALESEIERTLSFYLGQPNNAQIRSQIRSDLVSLKERVEGSNLPVLGMISSAQFQLLYSSSIPLSTLEDLVIQGSLILYGETEFVTFQTQISL